MSGLESEPLLASEQSHNTRQSSSLSARIRAALAEPQTALNGLEKLLAAGCVVFLLLTATFAGLFAGEAVRLGKERRHDGGGRHGEVTTTVTASVPATTTSHGSTTVVPGPPGPTSTGKPGKGKHVSSLASVWGRSSLRPVTQRFMPFPLSRTAGSHMPHLDLRHRRRPSPQRPRHVHRSVRRLLSIRE